MSDPKWLDLNKFRSAGYLQEVNRQFFHPLGLALAINVDDDGNTTGIAGIIDDRDDPEGWYYADGMIDPDMAQYVENERIARVANRESALGYAVQPVPEATS